MLKQAMLLIFCLFVLDCRCLYAEDFLLRVQPISPATPEVEAAIETIEFHVVEGKPIFVKTTNSQFLFRGRLRNVAKNKFELTYSCQIAELRADPLPRQVCEGTAQITLSATPELISEMSDKVETGTSKNEAGAKLDLKLSLKGLTPAFGARDDSSGWAVRLVDESGNPVVNAEGGLFGRTSGESTNWESIVSARSDKNGVMRFTEGREDLIMTTFYARHDGLKLYAVAHLDPDQARAGDKYYTIKMKNGFSRWSQPKE